MGFNSHHQAFDNYRRSYELEMVCMTSCIGYLTDLAQYLEVAPSKLTEEVQNLKQQNDQYRRKAEEGQQARALQEQVDKLEARNEEMEGILELMEDVLQQHTSCWATAQSMLEKLESLASPLVIVGGQAFLKGLQNSPTPQMGALLLHMLSNLPEELRSKILEIRQVIAEVKENFGVVVPTYRWDKDTRTFERVLADLYLATGKCMSQVPRYQLNVNPEQLVMGQLPKIPEWTRENPDGPSHNSLGPDLNHLQE
jgi:hypothetical protein